MHPCWLATLVAIVFAGLGVTADVAAQALAPASAANSPLYFPTVDKNHDGSISRSEVPKELAALRTYFDQYDVDHNHRLSATEYTAFLSTLSQDACRQDKRHLGSCALSPLTMGSPTMGVSAENAPKEHKQGQ
jgi:hypothetical protein